MNLRSSGLKRTHVILLAIAVGMTALSFGCGAEDGQSPTATQPTGDAPTPMPTPAVETTEDGYSVTIHMSAPSGMFQAGQAVIKSLNGGRTMITVDVEPPGDSAQPIHVHAGTCADVGAIVYPLNNVVRGHSETTLDDPIEVVVSSDRLINVHRSYQDFPTYTACGELPDLP